MKLSKLTGLDFEFRTEWEATSGRILVAHPQMSDVPFKRSLILLAEHDAEGTVGYVLNHPLGVHVCDILLNFPRFEAQLYLGGPVQVDTLHFVHRLGDQFMDTKAVGDGWFWGGSLNELREVIEAGLAHPEDFRFFLGYTGWGRGQLEKEIHEQSWAVSPLTLGVVFDSEDTDSLWTDAMFEMGDKFAVMSNFPTDPRLN